MTTHPGTTSQPLTRAGRWWRRSLAAAAVLAAGAALVAPPVGVASRADAADATGDSMTDVNIAAVVDRDGGVTFTEKIDYHFGPGTHHGIYRSIVVRQDVDDAVANGDPDTYRAYSLSDVKASSSTGAPTDVSESDDGGSTRIRIGDPDRTVDGDQSYELTYHLANVVNPFSDHAEFFYNIFKDDTVPKDKVELTVQGPAASTLAKCTKGSDSTPCDEAKAGNPATFVATDLASGADLTIDTSFPRTAFGDLSPDLRSGGSALGSTGAKAVSALALGGGVAIPVAAAALMGVLVSTRGRDEVYAGLTPGLTPGNVPGAGGGSAEGGTPVAATTKAGARPTVAVQFNPPPGVQPGMVGTIIDESADTVDVSATVVDLAVRGYLRIEEVQSKGMFARTDWTLTRLVPDPSQPPLRAYESTVLEGIFAQQNPVQLSELKYHFNSTLETAKRQMYDEVVQRGWFRKSPERQRQGWQALGFVLIGAGLVCAFFLAAPTRGIDQTARFGIGVPSGVVLGIGLVVAGLIFRVLGKRMAARTAEGSAMNIQSLGFKQYLVTAEANQIKFEEAQSVFSRFLPYAIVFGVADRWAGTFQKVAEAAAAAGQPLTMPLWYVYAGGGFPDFGSIADGVGSFATTAGGTFAATQSSGGSGGSGFGGGGGFSGGGAGGSSSGSW